ncbi:MAG: NlpC/P60 family protein [Tumebacillaceae bacterium]
MRNRKKLALMMAAAFTLMPFPTMIDGAKTQASSSITSIPAAYSPVSRAGVAINGVMKTAIDPVQFEGLYYVSFKQIANILNYDDISYNYGTKTYSATDGSVTVRVTIGGTRAMKGDEAVTIHAPRWHNANTYISLDTVSALFNTFTYFKPENGSIQIQMPARSYKVLTTDTIWKIAQAHHTTVSAVKSANGLTSDLLHPGQKLNLPAEGLTKEMEPGRMSAPPIPPQATAVQMPSTTVSAKQQAILRTAQQCLGAPYVFGAKVSQAPRVMDCSSFIQYVYGKNGVSLPRDSRQQSQVGTRVTSLQPGDLMFFKYPERYSDGRVGHVAIYMGNGKMIHTIPKPGVTITNYSGSGYWTRNFLFAKRVVK